jgi:MoxR-like ATPase
MASLVYTSGPNAGRKVALDQETIFFGRDAACAEVIDDLLVSGRHALLRSENGRWRLSDLKSSNGTFVNGRAIRTATLRHGDRIAIGQAELAFVENESTPLEPVVVATPPLQASDADLELVERMQQHTDAIRREVAKVIVGQRDVLEQMLMVLLSSGHGLLVGMPGLAKTLMVRTLARVLDMEFKRIQFTPDLMPTDITGTEVLETNRDTGEREFRFIRGPIFCNLLLADEINRTPPKTQAALLEAMQEYRVTAGNETFELDRPFFVLATQNPIEQEGTYPLPEAQLDRFMFNIWVDYPQEHEEEIIVSTTTVTQTTEPHKILTKQQVLQLQEVVRKIPVSPHVIKYTTRLVRATRPPDPRAPDFIREYVSTGAGPRASQYLILSAKARAVLEGRIHVSCADIRHAAIPVLRHRIYTNFAADSEGLTSMDLIRRLLQTISEPSENDYPPAPVAASA